MFAAINIRNVDLVCFFNINRGANVHAITRNDPEASTTLIQSLSTQWMEVQNNIEIVRLLVGARVDLDARDSPNERTALHAVAAFGKSEAAAEDDKTRSTTHRMW